MHTTFKIGLLAASLGIGFGASHAKAAVVQHVVESNAVNFCQAFTPGNTNTIRNRVIGAENIGSQPIPVACNFHSVDNGGEGNTAPTELVMYFSNNNASGTITVTCTLLTGYQSQTGSSVYASAKTTGAISANGAAPQSLSWHAGDNPNPGATTLGNRLIGINCTLPAGAIMNQAYLYWTQDNGI